MRRRKLFSSLLLGIPVVVCVLYGVKCFYRLAVTENLCQAASEGRIEVVKMYLDHGADVNGRGWQYTTPLLRAVEGRQVATAMLLLDRGADIELANNMNTPLIWAVGRNDEKMVIALLQRKANPNAKKNERRSALRAAMEDHHPRIAEILRNAGATESAED